MTSKLHGIVDSVVNFVQAWPVGIAASALIGSFATLAVVVARKKAEAKILSEIESKSGLKVRSNFWPRHELETFLAKALTANRKCICVTAPPRAGRTSLIHKALAENWEYEITMIDLRKSPFDDLSGFERRLAATQTDFDVSYSVASSIAGLLRTGNLDEVLGLEEKHKKVDLNEFKAALKRVEAGLPKNQPHLLFLDNTELYRSIVKDPAGLRALQIFLEWAITLTKMNNITVILACTTEFCFEWLLLPTYLDDLDIIFIGDLSMDDAKEYFRTKAEAIVPETLHASLPKPEEVVQVFGGRMHDIDKFLEHFVYSNGRVRPCEGMTKIMTVLQRAFYPTEFNPLLETVGAQPKWTASEAYTAFRMIADSPHGAVPYYKVHEKIGYRALQSLLRYGLVMYRPQCSIVTDIDEGRSSDLLCMRRPVELYALRQLLAVLDPKLLPALANCRNNSTSASIADGAAADDDDDE